MAVALTVAGFFLNSDMLIINVQWVFHTGETKDNKVQSQSHRFLGVMVGFGVLAVEPT